eukprot:7514687-Alexandrium_andersonii.AAC.1
MAVLRRPAAAPPTGADADADADADEEEPPLYDFSPSRQDMFVLRRPAAHNPAPPAGPTDEAAAEGHRMENAIRNFIDEHSDINDPWPPPNAITSHIMTQRGKQLGQVRMNGRALVQVTESLIDDISSAVIRYLKVVG